VKLGGHAVLSAAAPLCCGSMFNARDRCAIFSQFRAYSRRKALRFRGGFRIFGLIIEAQISPSYFYAGETIPFQ
jgi:hypothetical protein